MSLRTAARGFIAFLLSVPALQCYNNWAVSYPVKNVCGLRGSTVEFSCTYKYPKTMTVKKQWWFTNLDNEPVDLKDDTDYTHRVNHSCGEPICKNSCTGTCTLRIKDLTQRDSAVYKFRFTTNRGGGYTGYPGVMLSVKDIQMKVVIGPSSRIMSIQLECHNMCHLTGLTYTWYKNGIRQYQYHGRTYLFSINSEYRVSCGIEGSEHLTSPSVYAPTTPSVRVTPPGVIKEGSSVYLTCSSEANPVAKYTWFKVTTYHQSSGHRIEGQQLSFHSIQSSHSGRYLCQAKNDLGTKSSSHISIDVKYGPKHTYVRSSPPGEIREGGSVTLSCSSDANPAAYYTWFKENQPLLWEPSQPHTLDSVSSNDSGTYHCQAENQYGYIDSNLIFIDVLYAPKTPSVSVRPSGEIREGGSVTLSCSSDANPAATYTWFKENQILPWEPSQPYTLDSVSSKDSGTYHCQAKNQYGYLGSNSVFIDVRYAPKTPSVSVRPSGEMKEGGSVTLSCSSDANPAANYTWFKENQPLLWEPSQPHTLDSVSSNDSGTYHCQAENQYGYIDSNSIFIDVLYAPKTPSVSTRPSGEIKEGGSVILSCSSDANPAANYTWFKEHGGSVEELGENYTISNITTERGGNYYCEARNAVGIQNSTLLFLNVTATPSSLPTTVAAGTVAVLLATILLLIFLWMRGKRASRKACGQEGRPDTREESPPCPVYDNVSALINRSASAAQREPIEEQNDLHYASIHISRSKNQEVRFGFAGALVKPDHTEQVLYSAINLKRAKAVPE